LLFACSGDSASDSPTASAGGSSGASGASGTSGSGGTGGNAGGGQLIPCDVDAVLKSRCRSCHGDPPSFGAPMALVTYAQTQARSVTSPTQTVWQVMQSRVHDTTNPMPSTGVLPSGELAVLDAWFASGAPAGTESCEGTGGTGGTSSTVGPQALPCTPSHTFLAHGNAGTEDTSKYQVQPDAGNLLMCFTFKVPWDASTLGTAFAPIIDDTRVLHHWILFASSQEVVDGGVSPCDEGMPTDLRFLAGWAPGGSNRVMPDDVGLELPAPGESLVLQMHYWNVNGYTDAFDRSGVAMCTTTETLPHIASVSTTGSLNIAVPPHTPDDGYGVTGSCTPATTEPIHLIGAGPHMHRRGTQIRTEVWRNGDPNQAEEIVSVAPWSFDNQTSYPLDVILNPGDVLKTHCGYRNETSSTVYFGERTEDEMCFDFLTAYSGGCTCDRGRSRASTLFRLIFIVSINSPMKI
ncbi:MAG: hypothetical protein U0165_20945, partial [Polyangiaceae bacterium]